ncbi:hypothetical protein AGMMS49992_02690 [Clostridia bacterium]|nr:hypothetical protein AGMMS49992_02690 [Clostridia bacterium]
MLIRLAEPGDAVRLLPLNDLFNGEGCNTLDAIRQSLMHNNLEIAAVAEGDGGELVGFCCGQPFWSFCYDRKYGEVTELFVLEGCRRRGIGAALLGFVEQRFIDIGIRDFQLHTGKDNPTGQQFYYANGYIESNDMMLRKRLGKDNV